MTHAALDPALVKQANEALWAAHPELNRRQLVMPQDQDLAMQWLAHYKKAQAAQQAKANPAPAKPPPDKPADKPTDTGTTAPVQTCPKKAPCGEASQACQDALAGKDAKGNPIPEADLKRLKDTHEFISSRRKQAKWLGKDQAVDALDHWFNGCGKHKEIPATKTQAVRDESGANHAAKLKSRLAAGLPSRLALELQGRGSFVDTLEFDMDWKGGAEAPGALVIFSDDDLAYYGSTIHSRVHWRCTRVPQKGVSSVLYRCEATSWTSWVEDNYDFEDGKQTPFLPDDADMNFLARHGCGGNYQRSSKSWKNDPSSLTQGVTYVSKAQFEALVQERQDKNAEEQRIQQAERRGGALPSAEPAEAYPQPVCP